MDHQFSAGKIFFQHGWAKYPKKVKGFEITLSTLQLLNSNFVRRNADKSKRMKANRAQVCVHEEVANADWYERALVTESRIKAFFRMTHRKQEDLIGKATKKGKHTH